VHSLNSPCNLISNWNAVKILDKYAALITSSSFIPLIWSLQDVYICILSMFHIILRYTLKCNFWKYFTEQDFKIQILIGRYLLYDFLKRKGIFTLMCNFVRSTHAYNTRMNIWIEKIHRNKSCKSIMFILEHWHQMYLFKQYKISYNAQVIKRVIRGNWLAYKIQKQNNKYLKIKYSSEWSNRINTERKSQGGQKIR